MNLVNNRFKRIQFTYDLISGNVLQVDYQDGMPDQFHHRYAYDADNLPQPLGCRAGTG